MIQNVVRVFVALCFCVGIAVAQSPSPSPTPIVAQSPSPSATPIVNKELKRWLDIEALSVFTRYRYILLHGGDEMSAQQYQVNARARFKFDPKGKYSVVGVLGTGSNIQSGWNNTGWGTGKLQGDFPIKQLYFEAKPIKPLEIQFGGIGPNNGENSEITGYDNDLYLMGERVRIKYPKKLYFDEISLTNAFIGDITKPNVFRRFNRLNTSNYHQFLVRKTVNKYVSFSADYTFENGRDFLRQGIKLTAPELKVVDSLRFENYQLLDPRLGYGFALTGEKKLNKRVTFIGGVSDINNIFLNGDRFQRGTRVFFNTTYKVTRELSIGPVIIQAIGPLDTPATPRTRFEFIAVYNILEGLKHYGLF